MVSEHSLFNIFLRHMTGGPLSLEKARRGRTEKGSELAPPLLLSNGRVKASANAQKGGIVTNPLIIYVH